jgi:prophage antirepressor-like protein
MTNIDTLFINDLPIRYCFIDDKMFFLSADVCKLLDFKDPSTAIPFYCNEYSKKIVSLDCNNRPHNYSVINIDGVLKLVFNSHSKFTENILELLIEYSKLYLIKYKYKGDKLHILFEL